MRNLISLLAILFIPFSGWGENFHNYLSYVNKAESYIVQDNYKQAQNCYDSAFHIWKKPFAIDLFNDLKCANLDTDYHMVRSIAVRLVGLGCNLSFFDDAEYLRTFRSSAEYRSLINEYPAIRSKYLKNNNWKLRTQIEQMHARDQFLRRIDHNYTVLKDSIYNADNAIKASLISILIHKFPNEYDYGVFLADDTTVMDYHPLHIILLHNYGKFDTSVVHNGNVRTYDFTKILQDAVKKGDMHPEDFALLNDRSGKFMIGHGYGQVDMLIKINKRLYYDKSIPKNEGEIEKNRNEIGLCTLAEGRAKLIYNTRGNTNKFLLRKSLFGVTNYGNIFSEKEIKSEFIDTGVPTE